jgi:hypothetical protein
MKYVKHVDGLWRVPKSVYPMLLTELVASGRVKNMSRYGTLVTRSCVDRDMIDRAQRARKPAKRMKNVR